MGEGPVAYAPIFPNCILHRTSIKGLRPVLGWRLIAMMTASLRMAGMSLKEEQRSVIKVVLEAHSFFI